MMCCSTALVTGVGALKLPSVQIGLAAKMHQFIPPVVLGVWGMFIICLALYQLEPFPPGPAEWSSEYERLLSCSCWCVCGANVVRCMRAWSSLGIARLCG